MNLFLVRHGQSIGNVNKSAYFEMLDSDIGLTEQGKADAVKASAKIMDLSDMLVDNKTAYPTEKGPIYYNMFHSSYKRARETANVIHGGITDYQGYQINKLVETPLCREREWGGLRDIVEMGRKTEEHFNFYYTPTGGESFADCFHRVATFHQWLLQTSTYENNIVVAHGEFNKLYLMYLLNWSVEEFDRWRTPRNGEVYLIRNGELSSKTPLSPNDRK